MICPRCMYEQANAQECLKCGVVIDKFLAAEEDPRADIPYKYDDENIKIHMSQFRDDVKPRLISTPVKWLMLFFLTFIIGNSIFAYLNNRLSTQAANEEMIAAFDSTLKSELIKAVIVKELSAICIANKLEVVSEEISVEYAPDKKPVQNGDIHYIVTVSVPYRISLLGRYIDSKIDFTINESIPDDTMKAHRLRNLFDL